MRVRHSSTFSSLGFTLIELLIVVAIVAILATVVVLTINPAELLKEARDANRLSDVATLSSAINLYIEDQGMGRMFNLGIPSTEYLSVSDVMATTTAGDQCQSLGLGSGSTYHCAAPDVFRNVNGTGWIPVDFTAISAGTPLGSLPVDPANQTSTGLDYSYATDGSTFEVAAYPESKKYTALAAANTSVFKKGSNLTLLQSGGGNGTIAIDASASGYSLNATPTTAAFSTTGTNELLVAFIASDLDNSPVTSVTGGGLTWTKVAAKSIGGYGDVEIWKAIAPSPLSNVTISSVSTGGGYKDTLLDVVAFKAASGVGGSAVASTPSGAPSVTLTTSANGVWVWGVGEDWTTTIARTIGAQQTMSAELTNNNDGGSDQWVQYETNITDVAGTAVTLNDIGPTGDNFLFLAVEIGP
jgi:prepilin-type N-terminal cleavage/methylation domain-containing protein